MKVFTSILTFAFKDKEPYILLDGDKQLPTWQIKDDEKESFDIVKNGLLNIVGFDEVWLPRIEQCYTYEKFCSTYKEIIIFYTIYFESLFDVNNLSYKWVRVIDNLDNEIGNIIDIV